MSRRLYVIRAEMRLSRPDTEPLRTVALEPDPLEPFQRVFARCDPNRGERAEVLLDLLPLTPDERMEYRDRQRRAHIGGFADTSGGRRTLNPLSKLVDLLRKDVMTYQQEQEAGLGVPRNEMARRIGKREADQVAHRIVVPTALFYMQMLIRTTSYERKRAYAHLYALLACWEMWAGRNWFELVLTNFRAGYIGSNAPPRRWWFDYRYSTGRFGPLRNKGARVIAFNDLAGWITPPATTAPMAPPPRPQGARPPRPESAPPQRPPRPAADPTAQTPPARDADDTEVVVDRDGLDHDGRLLLFGMGRRATTVDRLAARVAAGARKAGAGVLVLDVDGAERRPRVAVWGDPARVHTPLLADGATTPVAGWNLVLPVVEGAPVDRAAVAVRALTVATRCADTGQAATLIDATVRTLRSLVAFLPRDLRPTLFQLPRLVEDSGWRETVLSVVDAPARRFWLEAFPGLDGNVVRDVVDLVRRLGDDPPAVALLGQAESTYDPYALLEAGRTVLLCGDAAPLDDALATLLWFDAATAARTLAEAASKAPPVLVGTAVQRYGHDQDGLFASELGATVASGTRVVLLTDQPDRQDTDLWQSIRGLVTAIAVDSVDRGLDVAAQWLGVDSEAQLRSVLDGLDVDECLVVAAKDGWQPRPIDASSAARGAANGRRSMPVRGVALRDTRARLDGLEERIAEHLSAPVPISAGPPKPALTPNVIQLDPSRRKGKPRE